MEKLLVRLLKEHKVKNVFKSKIYKGFVNTQIIECKTAKGEYRIYDILYNDTTIISSETGIDIDSCYTEYNSYEEMKADSVSESKQFRIHENRIKYINRLLTVMGKTIKKLEGCISVSLYRTPEIVFIIGYMLDSKVQRPLRFYPTRGEFSELNSFTDKIEILFEGEDNSAYNRASKRIKEKSNRPLRSDKIYVQNWETNM